MYILVLEAIPQVPNNIPRHYKTDKKSNDKMARMIFDSISTFRVEPAVLLEVAAGAE